MATNLPDVESILCAAVGLVTPEERTAYLQSACGGNEELRQRVEQLLQAHFRAGRFLEPSATILTDIEPPIQEGAGTVIGPYKLLQQIGEGGMGVVFLAEQRQPVQRQVALKIIKPGMDTRQVIARFAAEQQALALMDHPNIARVFDAGTTDSGRPYFVMELVKGVPLTEYCDQQHLTPQHRLELFIPICHALQHAHQKGIIHRDLKPSNVLVALYDGRPVPKVIDFGVAKATGAKLTERTMFTEIGQVVGTLEYMSPEQAELNQLDVDTRSDIYSLGVLLYELLTGTTPFERKRLKEAAFDELLRIVREEDPPKPSTRLSTTEELPSIAANRGVEPKKLSGFMRGDLDWIVMKALEKDRSRRYETANALSRDLERFLTDEPVEACPPSAIYRLRKFARRNKSVMFAASVVALVLVVGIGVSTYYAIEATRQAREALAAKSQMGLALKDKDAALTTARQAVDQMLTRTADEKLSDVPLAQPLRRALLEDALKFYEGFVAQAASDPTLRLEMARVLQKAGHLQRDLARYDDSQKSYQQSIDLLEGLVAASPSESSYRQQFALVEEDLAYTLQLTPGQSHDEEVNAHYRKALQIFTDLERDFPQLRQPTVPCLRYFANNLDKKGDKAGAEQLYREVITRGEQYLAQQPFDTDARVQLCWSCLDLNNFVSAAEGERVIQKGLDHVSILQRQNPRFAPGRQVGAYLNKCLGDIYRYTGRIDEAIPLYQQAVSEGESLCTAAPSIPGDWDSVQVWRFALVACLQETGRTADLKEAVNRSYKWLENITQHVPDEPEPQSHLLHCQIQFMVLLRSAGQTKEANELAQTLFNRWANLEIALGNAPEDAQRVVLRGIGRAGLGQWDQALADLQEAERSAAKLDDSLLVALLNLLPLEAESSNPKTAKAANCFREFYFEMMGQTAKTNGDAQALNEIAWGIVRVDTPRAGVAQLAVRLAKKACQLAPHNGNFENTLGVAYYRATDWQATIDTLRQAREHNRLSIVEPDAYFLAMAYAQQGHVEQANRWFQVADRWFQVADRWKGASQANNTVDLRWCAETAKLLDLKINPLKPVPNTPVELRALVQLLVDADPKAEWYHQVIGEQAAEEGAWDKAASEFSLAMEHQPNEISGYYDLALVRLHLGDSKGYGSAYAAMLQRFGTAADAYCRHWFTWTCGLAPESPPDLSTPLQVAQELVAQDSQNATYSETLGILLYRTGKYEQAAKQLSDAIAAVANDKSNTTSVLYPRFFLAMTKQKLGDTAAAKRLLVDAQNAMDEEIKAAVAWNRRATLELFRREAEAEISETNAHSSAAASE